MDVRVIAALPVVPLFREPDPSVEVVSQLIYGSIAYANAPHGTAAQWLQVSTQDGYSGWLRSSSVLPASGAARQTWVVSSNSANIYSSPSVKLLPELHLPWSARVTALPAEEHAVHLSRHALSTDEAARWIAVRLLSGNIGYTLSGNLLSQLPRLSLAGSLQAAQRFLGVTYTWGGVFQLRL